MNFNDFNSEQYRKAFDSLSAISKSIAPQIKALQNATVAMPGIWSNKINADAIKAISQDDHFNKAHVKYLECRLYEIALQVDR